MCWCSDDDDDDDDDDESGTTWMQRIVLLLLHGGDAARVAQHPALQKQAPWLEVAASSDDDRVSWKDLVSSRPSVTADDDG